MNAETPSVVSDRTGMGDGPAVLVLEDGRMFPGRSFGAVGIALGEAVFTTGMTGYQETLTDPSYRRQIVVATAPQIGNTGWVAGSPDGAVGVAALDELAGPSRSASAAGPVDPAARALNDNESGRIQVAGFVVRDLSPRPSNFRASTSLPEEMARQGVVGIHGVDTRSLTRHLRSAGVMRCGIFSAAPGGCLPDTGEMLATVESSPHMTGADLAGEVTTAEPYTVHAIGDERFTVAALDLGIKANTPQMLAARGITCHVLPASATIEQIENLGVDGVFLSNGPGDPATADGLVALTEQVLRRRIPLLGICFGNQILGRALGLGTYKLPFGHRGINQPVREEATGRVLVTAHNHGFAVDAPTGRDFDTPFGTARVAYTCLNDGVVERLECADVPAFSVQSHPEAAAGPHDAGYLFDRFADLMAAGSNTEPREGIPA